MIETQEKQEVTADDIFINKKVKVVLIHRSGSPLGDSHDGADLFTGAKFSTCLRINRQTNQLVPILTPKEQSIFEEVLALKKGDLSFYDRNSPFWRKFRVELDKDGSTLDLSNAIENLKWRVLKVDKRIAPSWEARFSDGEYRFALVEEGAEIKANSTKADLMKNVYREFGKIETNHSKMRNVLRVLGKKTTSDDAVFLTAEIQKLIDSDAKAFLDIVTDPSFETRVLIEKGLIANALDRTPTGGYRLKGGDDIGRNLNETITFLNSPLNDDVKVTLIAQTQQVK